MHVLEVAGAVVMVRRSSYGRWHSNVVAAARLVGFQALLLLVCACAAGGPSADRAYPWVGQPVAKVINGWRDRGGPVEREYTTPKGIRVLVIPESATCDIHYFVNAAELVSGFMLIGEKCTTYRGFSRDVVVIPTGGGGL